MGDTVSFYSFKGGTGRSTSLCNTAYELAKRGYSVGCIDFDLSAPGLHKIYDIGPNRTEGTKSIHDYIDPDKRTSPELSDYVLDVTKDYRNDSFDGELFLVYGEINADVAAKAGDRRMMLDAVKDLVKYFDKEYALDYVFLDSRSGISSQALPIFEQADHVFVFTRWTNQHKYGTSALLNWIGDAAGKDDGEEIINTESLVAVASNVPEEVGLAEIEEWRDIELPVFVDDVGLVHESEILRQNEEVVFNSHPGTDTAEEYSRLTDLLEDRR